MAWTIADLAAIDLVIAKGELTVQFADRSVTYRSMAELLQARAVISADLNQETHARYRLAATSKGV